MYKALFKKQFLQLFSSLFVDRKTGKIRSSKGTVGFIILYVVLFAVLGASFYMMTSGLAAVMIPMGLTWLYFVLMSGLTVFLGVFGGVFNTYASLYLAKDNDLLLSMPIPPSAILISRMVGVYAISMMYSSIVYIPAVVAIFVYGHPSPLAVVNLVLLWFLLGFLVHTLVCLFGWLVALVSSKLKNNKIITVVFSLILFGVYYYFCMNSYEFIDMIAVNSQSIADGMKVKAYPLYLFGRAAEGEPIPMLLTAAVILLLFAVVCLALSKTFIGIATVTSSSKKKVYREKAVKQKSLTGAMLAKEWGRFSSSATYMLNCGFSAVMLPLLGIASFFFAPHFREELVGPITELFGTPAAAERLFSAGVGVAVLLLSNMIDVTAPSVSLEGKSLWIPRSLPIPAADILRGKLLLQLVISVPAILIASLCMTISFGLPFYDFFLILLLGSLTSAVLAEIGLLINLKHPDFNWVNEVYPIKQSMSVGISLLGGILLSSVVGGLGIVCAIFLSDLVFFLVGIALFALLSFLLYRYLMQNGERLVSDL